MRPALKSVGLTLLLVCSTTIALCVPNITGLSPVLAQSTTPQDQKAEGDRLNSQGIQQCKTGQCEAALQSFQQALEIYREIHDRQNEGVALGNLGLAYLSLGYYAKAIDYEQQHLAIAREIHDRQGEGKALGNLGIAYQHLGDYARAIDYKQQWLVISRDIHDRESEAAALVNLAIDYLYLGNSTRVIEYAQQALVIARAIYDRSGEGKALNSLGVAYKNLGDYVRAIEYYQQALVIARGIKDRQSESASLANLGEVYRILGDYVRAIEYYQQALVIVQEIHDPQGEGKALGKLGKAYYNLGNYTKAIEYYRQFLMITRKIHDRQSEGAALIELGNAYESLGNYTKAIEYQQQGLVIARELHDRRSEGAALGNLGVAYDAQGNHAKAIDYYHQLLVIARELHDRRSEGAALGNLGVAYDSLGNYTKAIEYHQQLLAIAQEADDHESEGIALSNIGVTLAKQKQSELAIVFYKQSVNVREGIREGIRTLPKDDQEAYIQSVAGTYRRLADLLIEQGRILEAQEVLELLKVQELKDFDRTSRAKISNGKIELDPTEQAIVGKYTTFVEFGQKLRDCQSRKPQCADYDNLTKLRIAANAEYAQAVKSFEAAIKERKDKDEKNFLDPNNALNRKAQEIITAQPNTPTAIVYSLVTDDKLWLVLVIKGEALRSFEIKLPQGELNEVVRKFRALLEQCEAKTCTAADTAAFKVVSQQLYGWLFPPALQQELQRGKIKHLVFAQDRITRYIPMAALFDGKQYLIENYAISTIVSASFTYNDPPPKRQDISVLAAGLSNAVPPKFSALDEVPRELDAIVQSGNTGIFPGLQLLNQTFDFLGLQNNLYGHNILHIATHGEFVRSQADASYILLGNGKPLPIPDIMQLSDLGSVYLVVLSACQTALADRDATGIEISNVSYSFLDKGVKAVIASLWQVNDASTSLLMQQFYKQLAEGKPKVQALQEAQLSLLQSIPNTKNAVQRSPTLVPSGAPPQRRSPSADFSHPYYWAPFILIGNGL